MNQTDAAFMARAIRLAERGFQTCAPNPRVGCVLVKAGQIIAEGWHVRAGEGHAEINALGAAADPRGATAYVSLEPCNHQGRTGPCSQALIDAGIARVVYAVADAGAASGGGAQALRAAGLEVEAGLLEAEARALNPGFHRRVGGGLPWVRMKIAQSLDGRTALPDGQSQWITAAPARQDGHRWRARSCAIVTGIGTVLADDPRLDVRLEDPPWGAVHQPLRVVIDSALRTPAKARVRADRNHLLFHAASAGRDAHGVVVASDGSGLDLRACIGELARRGCNEILIEAGAELNGALLRAGVVDELLIYTAPCLLGAGRAAAELGTLANLDQRIAVHVLEQRRLGPDSRIIARLIQSDL